MVVNFRQANKWKLKVINVPWSSSLDQKTFTLSYNISRKPLQVLKLLWGTWNKHTKNKLEFLLYTMFVNDDRCYNIIHTAKKKSCFGQQTQFKFLMQNHPSTLQQKKKIEWKFAY